MHQILEASSSILSKKSTCQSYQDEVEGEDDEQMEMELIMSVFDLLTDISKTLGPIMLPYFEAVGNAIAPYQVINSHLHFH